MTGQRPSIFFKLCWKYFTPLLLLVSGDPFLSHICLCLTQTVVTLCHCWHYQATFISYVVDFRHITFNGRYVYPDWAYALGWTMMLSSVLMIPLWAVGQMCCTKGTFKQVSDSLLDNKDFLIFCQQSFSQVNATILCAAAADDPLPSSWWPAQHKEDKGERRNSRWTNANRNLVPL